MLNLGDSVAEGKFRPKLLTEQVSQVLMEAILNGSIAPGQQLIEIELQNLLGVSRSPLREAFRDLEKKGLVVIVPRRGAFVKAITKVDVQENFPVRASLEGLAAREAHPKLGEAELGRMAAALKGMQAAGELKDSKAYRENHQVFHDTFINASGNQLLVELLQNLRMHRIWYFVSFRYHQDIRTAMEVHSKIFDLFQDRDAGPDLVEQVVRNHIEEALPKIFGDMENQSPEAGQNPQV